MDAEESVSKTSTEKREEAEEKAQKRNDNVIMEEEEEMEEEATKEDNVHVEIIKDSVIPEVVEEEGEEVAKEDGVKTEEIKENVEMDKEATKDDNVDVEIIIDSVILEVVEEEGEEVAKEEGVKTVEIIENVEIGKEAAEDENKEAEKKIRRMFESRTGSISTGSRTGSVDYRASPSLQALRQRLASRTSSLQMKPLTTLSGTNSQSNNQTFRERVASRAASSLQSKETKLDSNSKSTNSIQNVKENKGTLNLNDGPLKTASTVSGTPGVTESTPRINPRQNRDSVGSTEGGKEGGNIMGGDWRKVISKRRGATCSVEVIAKLRQSQMLVDRYKADREYVTGSVFSGHVDAVGMQGECNYTMMHGVIFEGEMLDGRCGGPGTLVYPNDGRVDGTYSKGKLAPSTYTFSDGLVYELQNWTYCNPETPDRRFQQEIKFGLKPVCTSLKTQLQPTRTIPEGCYDTGDGFYNPKTRCVTSALTGNIIRIPTNSEAHWIAKNCRKAWVEQSGYRPNLNPNFRLDDVNYAPLLMANQRRRTEMKSASRSASS